MAGLRCQSRWWAGRAARAAKRVRRAGGDHNAAPVRVGDVGGAQRPVTGVEEARRLRQEIQSPAQHRLPFGGVGKLRQKGQHDEVPVSIGDVVPRGVAQPLHQTATPGVGQMQGLALNSGLAGPGLPGDQPVVDQPGDRGVKRAVADRARVPVQLLHPAAQLVAVQRLLGKEAENHQLDHAESAYLESRHDSRCSALTPTVDCAARPVATTCQCPGSSCWSGHCGRRTRNRRTGRTPSRKCGEGSRRRTTPSGRPAGSPTLTWRVRRFTAQVMHHLTTEDDRTVRPASMAALQARVAEEADAETTSDLIRAYAGFQQIGHILYELLPFAGDPRPDVRCRVAAELLDGVGGAADDLPPPVLGALLDLARDPDPTVRLVATATLAHGPIDTPAPRDVLAAHLAGDDRFPTNRGGGRVRPSGRRSGLVELRRLSDEDGHESHTGFQLDYVERLLRHRTT
jgi:hypothetical protein